MTLLFKIWTSIYDQLVPPLQELLLFWDVTRISTWNLISSWILSRIALRFLHKCLQDSVSSGIPKVIFKRFSRKFIKDFFRSSLWNSYRNFFWDALTSSIWNFFSKSARDSSRSSFWDYSNCSLTDSFLESSKIFLWYYTWSSFWEHSNNFTRNPGLLQKFFLASLQKILLGFLQGWPPWFLLDSSLQEFHTRFCHCGMPSGVLSELRLGNLSENCPRTFPCIRSRTSCRIPSGFFQELLPGLL